MRAGVIWVTTSAGLLLSLSAAQATHTGSSVLGAGSSHAINTDSAEPLEPLQWAAGIRVENTEFDSLTDTELNAAVAVDEDADLHSIDSLLETSLTASFGVTSNFTIGLKLPYISRQSISEPEHGHDGEEEAGEIERLGDSSGLGDLSLYGLFRFYQDQETQSNIALLFGVKTPTGETREIADNGERFETELQPGSGSSDPFAGVALGRGIGESLNLDTSVTYRIATEGSQNTDLGDVLSYNAGLAYKTPWIASQLNLILELNAGLRT